MRWASRLGGLILLLLPSLLFARGTKPNIVLIVVDATRADALGCYRSEGQLTPHLNRLAGQGIVYENCIVAAPWTLPSMASLFTGLPPRDHGVNSAHWELSPQIQTLPELLRDAGYRTAGFSTNAFVGTATGFNRGFDEFVEVWRALDASRKDEGAEVVNEWAIDWIDSLSNRENPFFLFLFYFEPHFPYNPPPGWLEKGSQKPDRETTRELRLWKHPREVGYVLQAPGMDVSPHEFEALKALYEGEIAYVDQVVGDLLSQLKQRRLLDNTLVAVTADHGEHFGEHALMDHKMSVYEEVIRVPLIISAPGRLPAGKRIASLVQNTDLAPSILALAGSPSARADDRLGLSQRQGEISPRRRLAFVEFARPQIFLDIMKEAFPKAVAAPFDRSLAAVRSDRFKLIWASDGRHQLFDLSNDPAEARNLIEKSPEVARELLDALEAFKAAETEGF